MCCAWEQMYFEGCSYAVNLKAFSFWGLQCLEEIPDFVSCRYKKLWLLALRNSTFLLRSKAIIRTVIAMFYSSVYIHYRKGLFKKMLWSIYLRGQCVWKQESDTSVFAKQRLSAEVALSSEYSSPANFLTKSCFQRKKIFFKKDNLGRVLISDFPSSDFVKEYLWGNTRKETVCFYSILIFFTSNKKSLHK